MDDHKEAVLAYAEAFNAGDEATLRRLFTPDAVIHGVSGSGGIDVALAIWKELRDGLASRLTIDALAAEGSTVAARITETGRWIGPFRGQTAATGKPYHVTAMEWFVFRDGRIAERWGARDTATIARHVGMALG